MQPEVVAQGEVVADLDVEPAVVVHVPEGNGEGLCFGSQPLRHKGQRLILVDVDAAAAVEQVAVAQIGEQPGVVRGGDGVEIAVAIEVGPVDDVGGLGEAAQEFLGEVAVAQIAPVVDCAAGACQHNVEPSVGVHVNEGDGAGAPDGHFLLAEVQIAVVPEN